MAAKTIYTCTQHAFTAESSTSFSYAVYKVNMISLECKKVRYVNKINSKH